MNNIKRLVLATLLALQTGCAPLEWSLQDDGAFDPIEPINRKVYTFNSDVDALLGKLWRLSILLWGRMFAPRWQIFTAIWENPKTSLIMSCNKTAKTPSTPWRAFFITAPLAWADCLMSPKTLIWKSEKPIWSNIARLRHESHRFILVLPIFGPSPWPMCLDKRRIPFLSRLTILRIPPPKRL